MNDEETLRDAAAGNDAEALQNVQIKQMMLGRRGFLLKSVSVAGSIASPTLIGAGALAIARPAMASTTATIYAADDQAFYQETITAGLPSWRYATANWDKTVQSRSDGKLGYKIDGLLVLYQRGIFNWFYGYPVGTYQFTLYTVVHDFDPTPGHAIFKEDIDTSRTQSISEMPEDADSSSPPIVIYNDTAPHYGESELRRRLDPVSDWGEDWQIPSHWVDEFNLWSTARLEYGRPTFGVLVHQWGSRHSGIALRVMNVFDFQYDPQVNGVLMRTASLRRRMYQIGVMIGGQWVNLAIDEIQEGMRPLLYQIAPTLFHEYRLDGYVDDWPGFPAEAFRGWQDQMALQRNDVRGGLAAILAVLPGCLGQRDVFRFYTAFRTAGRNMEQLRNDFPPTLNGLYTLRPLSFYHGIVPQRFAGVLDNRVDVFVQVTLPDAGRNPVNWLQAMPRSYERAPLPQQAVERNPQLLVGNRFPAVIPGDLPMSENDRTRNATIANAQAVRNAFIQELGRPDWRHSLINLMEF